MKLGKIFALFASVSVFVLLSIPNAHAGGYSGGYWWENCPATADFPNPGNTNGSAYQDGFQPAYLPGTLSLVYLTVGATDSNGTSLECHYIATSAGDILTIKSPPAYSFCRATGSFGWFQCHQ